VRRPSHGLPRRPHDCAAKISLSYFLNLGSSYGLSAAGPETLFEPFKFDAHLWLQPNLLFGVLATFGEYPPARAASLSFKPSIFSRKKARCRRLRPLTRIRERINTTRQAPRASIAAVLWHRKRGGAGRRPSSRHCAAAARSKGARIGTEPRWAHVVDVVPDDSSDFRPSLLSEEFLERLPISHVPS
jgi:hypothetical protein